MRPTRYRVSLLAPCIATLTPPPLSDWFVDRRDAEMIAGLSARECPAIALIEYADRAVPRLVRFHGSDGDRERYVLEARWGEADGERAPAFFASTPLADRRTAA